MHCLVIGASSYIAKAFVKSHKQHISIIELSRNSSLTSYFELGENDFKNFDVVINFSAIVHQKNPSPELSEKINTELPVFLAKTARQAGVHHFIQMSTIAVYDPDLINIDQASIPNPRTLYGRTKLEADISLLQMQAEDFKISIIRPPIVYGYKAPGNMHSLISLIKKGLPLPFLYSENKRAILYIDNLTEAIYQIITKKAQGVFLLHDKLSPSLAELCRQINSELHNKSSFFRPPSFLIMFLIYFKQLPFFKLYGDLMLDDSFAQKNIGEYSKVDFHTAIKKTIQGEL